MCVCVCVCVCVFGSSPATSVSYSVQYAGMKKQLLSRYFHKGKYCGWFLCSTTDSCHHRSSRSTRDDYHRRIRRQRQSKNTPQKEGQQKQQQQQTTMSYTTHSFLVSYCYERMQSFLLFFLCPASNANQINCYKSQP